MNNIVKALICTFIGFVILFSNVVISNNMIYAAICFSTSIILIGMTKIHK